RGLGVGRGGPHRISRSRRPRAAPRRGSRAFRAARPPGPPAARRRPGPGAGRPGWRRTHAVGGQRRGEAGSGGASGARGLAKSTGWTAGRSAQGQTVRGTISKGPGVSVALGEPGPERSWLAQALGFLVGTAEAVTGTPAVGVTVQLSCSGAPTLTTTTNSNG